MNTEIIQNLEILKDYYQKTKDKFRTIAYAKAIVSIKALPFQLTIENVRSQKIPNVGESILQKIEEFLQTQQIKKIGTLKKEFSEKEKVIELFTQIWGVGDVKALELYENGFRTIADLQKDPRLLTKNQKIGLKYYEDLLKPMNREFVTVMKYVLKFFFYKLFGKDNFKMDIAGSYRRQKPFSNDIDCLLTTKKKVNLTEVVEYLTKNGVILESLGFQKEKFMGIAQCPSKEGHPFRLDIEFIPPEEYVPALIYFTGSKYFNLHMRETAKKQGLLLNQHGLYKGGKLLVFKNEKELFDKLGMEYVPPEKR